MRNEKNEASRQAEQDGIKNHINTKLTNEWGGGKYGDNVNKSYALLFSYFSRVIQNIIDTCTTYQSTIQCNPIKLFNTIKVIMHDTEITKHPFASLTEEFYRVLNMKQYEKVNHVGT